MQAKFVVESLRHSLMANIVAVISSTRFGSSRQCRRRQAGWPHSLASRWLPSARPSP